MIVIHNIARSIFVDKKGRKRKIMEEVREYCQIASNLQKKWPNFLYTSRCF